MFNKYYFYNMYVFTLTASKIANVIDHKKDISEILNQV